MYRYPVPDCYDPIEQERSRDLAYTIRMMRRPLCLGCNEHILTETCVDLSDFGIDGYICEKCMERNMQYTCELDDYDE